MQKIQPLLCFLLLALAPCSHLLAQGSVFVLVDVSASGPKDDVKFEARAIVRDLLTSSYDPSKYSPNWQWAKNPKPPFDPQKGVLKPLLDVANNATLMVMPVGERDTYMNYIIGSIQTLPSDVDAHFTKHYPREFRDNYTHLDMAKAKAAGVARNANISNYYLIEVSDGLNDTDSNPYSPKEQDLLDQYGSDSAKPTVLAVLNYYIAPDSVNYKIKFSAVKVDGTTNIPPVPGLPKNTPNSKPEIILIRPKGDQRNPTEMAIGAVGIAWQCLGCDTNTLFIVDVAHTKDARHRQSHKTKSFSESFTLQEPGEYRVSVRTDKASSKTAYFKIKGEGGGGGFLGVLTLLAAVGGLFWWLKKRNDRQFEAQAAQVPEDDFSKNYQPYKPNQSKKQDDAPPPSETSGGGTDF